MSRGKAFICWLGTKELYQGDAVEFRIKKRWFRGIIHCHHGLYYVHRRKRKHWVLFRHELRPAPSA